MAAESGVREQGAAGANSPQRDRPTWRAGYADCFFGQIHYLVEPPAQAGGSAVVLLNPRARACRRLLPRLVPKHRVFIVDLPGFGGSTSPPPGISIAGLAQAIAESMESWGVTGAHIFGIHTGNKVAAALAANWPAKASSVILCGKTHSLIPDRSLRNDAMKNRLAANLPDSALIRLEGKFADDPDAAGAVSRVYEANFEFDLGGAMSKIDAPTLVLEITTREEDALFGRQGRSLAALARNGSCVEIEETDATGIDLYVGSDRLGEIIAGFIDTS